MVYSGSAKNCHLEVATTASYVHIPTWQEEESAFLEGEKEFGRAVAEKNPLEELRVKNRVTFHWLSYDSLSLAELLPGKKRKFLFFLLDSATIVGHEHSLSDLLTAF